MRATPAAPPANPELRAAAEELARAETLSTIMEIVRSSARQLTGADGATFVLKEGGNCFYADEDAIGPLWKGRRFPQSSCVSGWVMMQGQPAVIENIFEDPRIPGEAYRSTFVRSLAMIPVGDHSPVAAIGNYWAQPHRASREQVALLRELARHTAAAIKRLS